MATQITTWSPDTCQCVLQYSWDDTVSPPVNTFFAVVKACQFHNVLAFSPHTMALDHDEHTKQIESKWSVVEEIIVRNENRIIGEAKERDESHRLKVERLRNSLHPRLQRFIKPVPVTHVTEEQARSVMGKRREEIEGIFTEALLGGPHTLAISIYNTVLDENQRKNKSVDAFLSSSVANNISDLLPGNTVRTLKDSVILTYTGTAPNRVLNVNFGSLLTAGQKNNLQSTCDTQFGAGKVIIL